jgi:hypothetical protein
MRSRSCGDAVSKSAVKHPKAGPVPKGFRIRRDLPIGRHPILDAFPGLDRLDTAERHQPQADRRARLYSETEVELVPEDIWMYVSPHEVPKAARAQWKPVVSPKSDCIVIGESHLRESPDLILFLDIFHELCHILQRHDGAELWDRRYSYTERPTEVQAYKFVVDEARRFGVADDVLRDYLRVEWIDDKEFLQLLEKMGVTAA